VTEASAPLPTDFRLRAARAVDWLFAGEVRGSIYTALRVGTALVFLVRHSDWLRPWVFLEHHRFVRGLMFLEASPAEPRLISPIIAGFTLGDGATRTLVLARTALSVSLLLGIRAQASAVLLALFSYALILADRYRYYHHLHLLYVSVAFLALAPIGRSLNLEHALRHAWGRLRGVAGAVPKVTALAPLWPLQLVRALVIGVYCAAGVSKIDASWLSGDALRHLERFYVLKGSVWELVRDVLGYRGVAVGSLATELLLPVGLMVRRTRRAAILGGLAFHAGISASMPVYSFGVQMAVLLFAFWPTSEPPPVDSSTKPPDPDTRTA
jgi:hypothetical protein